MVVRLLDLQLPLQEEDADDDLDRVHLRMALRWSLPDQGIDVSPGVHWWRPLLGERCEELCSCGDDARENFPPQMLPGERHAVLRISSDLLLPLVQLRKLLWELLGWCGSGREHETGVCLHSGH